MFHRITNAFDTNRPIIKVIDQNQADRINEFYNEDSDKITRKKIVVRIIGILILSLAIVLALYQFLFVLELKEIPAEKLTVYDVSISSEDVLSFRLQSNDFYLSDNYWIDVDRNRNDIYYIRIKQPLITLQRSYNQDNSELFSSEFEISVKGVSAVSYMGTDLEDVFVIWER